MAELQCTKDFLCPGCCSCWAGRSLPATVANSFPFLAGVSGGVKVCIAVLVRYASSKHGMTKFDLFHLLFLLRIFAGGVGSAHQSVCLLSCLSINESIGCRSLTCISSTPFHVNQRTVAILGCLGIARFLIVTNPA